MSQRTRMRAMSQRMPILLFYLTIIRKFKPPFCKIVFNIVYVTAQILAFRHLITNNTGFNNTCTQHQATPAYFYYKKYREYPSLLPRVLRLFDHYALSWLSVVDVNIYRDAPQRSSIVSSPNLL